MEKGFFVAVIVSENARNRLVSDASSPLAQSSLGLFDSYAPRMK